MDIGDGSSCHSCKAIPLERDSVIEIAPRGKNRPTESKSFSQRDDLSA